MQTSTIGTRNHTRHLWIIGAVLALVLTVATIATVAVSRSGEPERASPPLPVMGDLTTLALDRDGADLFPMTVAAAPNTTDLSLDRDGADMFAPLLRDALDTTTLRLDRNGSDYMFTPSHPWFSNPYRRLVDKQ